MNDHFQKAFNDGECSFEWQFNTDMNEAFPAQVFLTTCDCNGKLVWLACISDISELKKRERQLQLLNSRLESDLSARILAENKLRSTASYLDVYHKIVDRHAIVAETDK